MLSANILNTLLVGHPSQVDIYKDITGYNFQRFLLLKLAKLLQKAELFFNNAGILDYLGFKGFIARLQP
jgi:hypothetical protein